MGTAGPGGRYRLGRLGATALLLIPLLGATAASGENRTADASPRVATTAPETRIAFAGTRHRSLGVPTSATKSGPLFDDDGPVHNDIQPSALGDQLVFASRRDEKDPQIYLRSASGSVRRLTFGMDAAHPRLTPDGAVVFDAATPGPDGKSQRDLWRVGTDGSGLKQLTKTSADETYPTVSPDGKHLAYSSNEDTADGAQIYVRSLDGQGIPTKDTPTRVTDARNGTATEPIWNPVNDDDHRGLIAYTATKVNGRSQLRETNGTGTTDGPLLGGNREEWRAHAPAWMPGGDEVLFLSPEITCQCEGNYDHVFRAKRHDAGTPGLVLDEDREIGSPTWLGPLDGGRAVVEHLTAEGPHTVTLQDIRADGADPRDLNLTILNEDPEADTNTDAGKDPLFQPRPGYDPWTERQSYTPDGRRIVVTRFLGDPGSRVEEIWLADADGTHPEALKLDGRGRRRRQDHRRDRPARRRAPGPGRPARLVLRRHHAGLHPQRAGLRRRRQQAHLDRAREEPEPADRPEREDLPGHLRGHRRQPRVLPRRTQHRLQPQERRRPDRRAQRHHRDLRVREGLPGTPPRLRP
jgi:hypothetical protein